MSDPSITGGHVGYRRRVSRALVDMHYLLRTEGGTPLRQALSVWLGVLIGCTPLWGVHLLLCMALGRLLGLSRIKCFVATHINNPLTAPFLIYFEIALGHWLLTGDWPSPDLAEARAAGLLSLGRDVFVGSLVLGTVLGAVLAAVAYFVGLRWSAAPLRVRLREEASRKYLETGIPNWEFVRAKLKFDTVFDYLIRSGDLSQDGRLLDLGCGRGILLALVASARTLFKGGDWPAEGPPPPGVLELTGVESRNRLVRTARTALGEEAEIREEDLATFDPPSCRIAVLLDVLHFLPFDDQERLLRRVAAAIEPGGSLILREPDAAAGARFALTRFAGRLFAILRGRWKRRLYFRSANSWMELVRQSGLSPESQPMSAGTPYARVLIRAVRTATGTPSPPRQAGP